MLPQNIAQAASWTNEFCPRWRALTAQGQNRRRRNKVADGTTKLARAERDAFPISKVLKPWRAGWDCAGRADGGPPCGTCHVFRRDRGCANHACAAADACCHQTTSAAGRGRDSAETRPVFGHSPQLCRSGTATGPQRTDSANRGSACCNHAGAGCAASRGSTRRPADCCGAGCAAIIASPVGARPSRPHLRQFP